MDGLLSESTLRQIVDLLVRFVEAAGALVIFAGAALAVGRFLVAALRRGDDSSFTRVRLGLGRYLALGLEFQLASDVLRTAIAPSFQEIGKLGAIAAIRTALNYFLRQELTAERSEIQKLP